MTATHRPTSRSGARTGQTRDHSPRVFNRAPAQRQVRVLRILMERVEQPRTIDPQSDAYSVRHETTVKHELCLVASSYSPRRHASARRERRQVYFGRTPRFLKSSQASSAALVAAYLARMAAFVPFRWTRYFWINRACFGRNPRVVASPTTMSSQWTQVVVVVARGRSSPCPGPGSLVVDGCRLLGQSAGSPLVRSGRRRGMALDERLPEPQQRLGLITALAFGDPSGVRALHIKEPCAPCMKRPDG